MPCPHSILGSTSNLTSADLADFRALAQVMLWHADVDHLKEMGAAALEVMLTDVGMKPGHAAKFMKMLRGDAIAAAVEELD